MRRLVVLLMLASVEAQECAPRVVPALALDRQDQVVNIDPAALRAEIDRHQVRISEAASASAPPVLVALDRDIAERSDAWDSALVLVQSILERLPPEREAAVVEYDSGRSVHQTEFAKVADTLAYIKALPDAAVVRAQKPRGKQVSTLTRLAEFIRGSEKLRGGMVLVLTDYGRRSGGDELKRAALERGTAITAAVLEPSAAWALGYSTSDLEAAVEATGGVALVVAPMAGKIDLRDDRRITQNPPRLDAAPALGGAARDQRPNFEHHTYSLRERAEKFVAQVTSYKLFRIESSPGGDAKLKIELPGQRDVVIRHPRRVPACK